ncbi:MAG TPA: NAD-dependent DNA ligase LigA [Niabella sp.]|nr:NAD-dependent DNA ligase LigA [Niabella sp.]HQW14154.1 NAD-dependent DNA ligase LigA [Niabella sp.]HQX19554.1 NAD-dependent DNA ligase LigA [Niabella sp.]HQX40012.1 NAD-dependent DNA ligase LigA [Niabella sp.]HRB08035.1 NAD-dependent DNA ligase LigA [Niabella sp.]
MYNKEQTISLQEASRVLLKENADILISEKNTEALRTVLRFHEYRYYVLNDPYLADGEYDQLYKLLERSEKAYPDWITKDSPTQRVGKELSGNFVTVPHLVPMLSLDNSYNEADLNDFDRRAKQLSKLENIEYCVEPKFDGGGISLIYENDFLVRGATRGNGIEGDDITTNIKQIGSVPLSANFSRHGLQQVEIRGEVLMNKTSFKQYNESLMEKGLAPLANPRNAATGSLRIKDPSEVKRRNLEAFVYFISSFTLLPGHEEPKALGTHHEALKLLWELGFRSPVREMRLCQNINEVVAFCQAYEQERDDLPYEIDGMVVKVNHVAIQEELGMTSHHPRWAMAFKFKARQGTSKLLNVEFQVGRTGSITPVAKIDPVYIGGVTVSSISLFNEDIIKEKDLMIGDTVLVERAGDVIPYIVKSLSELRTGNERPIEFPEHCPVCTSRLFKEEGEAVWRCINIECSAQVMERMIHFVSKDALDIRGLGEANIKKFYELGYLKDIPGIYNLDYDAISQLEGFGKKSIDKLKGAIEQSKSQPLNRLIFALGIRFVGETTAKVLAQKVEHLFDLKNFSLEELQSLEDIGPKVAGSIVHFFSSKANVNMLEELQNLGVQMKNEKKPVSASGGLNGLSFLFTGTLPTLKRSDAEAIAEAKGGKILSGVSAKLNYLIVGEDAGSKLEKAKKLGTINIISEAEFLNLISAL